MKKRLPTRGLRCAIPFLLTWCAASTTKAGNGGVSASSATLTDYWPEDSWPQWRRDPAKNAFNPVSSLPESMPVTFWQYSTPSNAANGSPAVVNGKVFFGTADGTFFCVKQITGNPNGELVWSYGTGGRIWDSPAVAYNRVFFQSKDGYLYCLKENPPNPPNGDLLWRYSIGPTGIELSSPCVADGKVYIGSHAGYLYCFDALTTDTGGRLLWRYDCEGRIHGSVAVADGRVYVGNGGGALPASGFRLLCLKAQTSNPDGELIWAFRIGDKTNGSLITPAVAYGKVYYSADDGWLRCLDGATGAVVWQRFITQMDGPSPTPAYGRIYKSYESRGGIDCWEAVPASDPEGDGTLIWSYDTPEVDRAGASVAGGTVLHTSWYDKLYAFDAHGTTPTIKWVYSPIDVPVSQFGPAPSIANGMIFVGDGSNMRALRQAGANIPPLADASITSSSGLTVKFAGSGTDLDGSIASYTWRFGDGTSSTLQDATHAYPSPGWYIASITVQDNEGAENEATVFVVLSTGQPAAVSNWRRY